MLKLLTRPIWANQAITLTLAVFLGVWASPGFGAQVGGSFLVTVKLIPPAAQVPPVAPGAPTALQPDLSYSAFCKSNSIPTAHGAIVTVVCTTGAVVGIESGSKGQPFTPMHGGAYRFVTQVSNAGVAIDALDNFSNTGTTTAWRVVHLAERDYLEMAIGW